MAVNESARADVAAIENGLGQSLSAEYPLSLGCRAYNAPFGQSELREIVSRMEGGM